MISEFTRYCITSLTLTKLCKRQRKGFWFNNIIDDVEPERKLSDYDNTVNRIDAVRLDTNKELIAKNLIAEYLGCDANIKSLEKHRDEIKANLLGLVDTDIQEVLDSTGNTLYTIKSQTRNSFDKG